MNKDALTTDAEAFNPDLPPSERCAGKWDEYFRGTRLLLVSRDERLKAIYYDSSLTQAQKYEQSKALFESTDKIESSLNPTQVAKFNELHQHHSKPSQYLPVTSGLPRDVLVTHLC